MKIIVSYLVLIAVLSLANSGFGENQYVRHLQGQDLSAVNENEAEIEAVLTKIKVDQKQLKKDVASNYGILREEIKQLRKNYISLNSELNAVKTEYMEQTKQYREQLKNRTVYITGFLVITAFALLWVAIVTRKRLNQYRVLEKIIAQDSSLVSYLKSHLEIITSKSQTTVSSDSSDKHAFPVRVASEIYRMRKRIESMDENTKGLNALKNALNRLDDDLNQRGYVMSDLSGSPYIDELTVKIANTIEREDLDPGSHIINRMIEPQILFNGLVVGHGEVELAVGVKK